MHKKTTYNLFLDPPKFFHTGLFKTHFPVFDPRASSLYHLCHTVYYETFNDPLTLSSFYNFYMCCNISNTKNNKV